MSAYKTLLASDIIVTPVTYNKSFTFSGSAQITGSGIDFIKDSTSFSQSISLSNNNNLPSASYWNSIKQLYYSNYLYNPENNDFNSPSGSPAVVTQNLNGVLLNLINNQVYTGSIHQPNFENYLTSTININRTITIPYTSSVGVYQPSSLVLLTIPQNLYGDYINPKTFNISWYQSSGTTNISIYDDGEGNVYLYDSFHDTTTWVGNIIYYHGIIIFTNNLSLGDGGNSLFIDLINDPLSPVDKIVSFQSSYTIYETQIKCNIRSDEFTTTLNPTLISSSQGQVYDYATGSFFGPYITTVGLYNENQDLLMVAKLSQPLRSSPTTDTNIIINLDR